MSESVLSSYDSRHLIADLKMCASETLEDEAKVKELLEATIAESGLSMRSLHIEKLDPQGVSAIALIAGSHVALHTYPEHCAVSIDAFHSGSDDAPLKRLLMLLKAGFRAEKDHHVILARGERFEILDS